MFFMGCVFVVSAQKGIRTADSLKAVVAEQRALIGTADSSGNWLGAFEGRMVLAPLVHKQETVDLLQKAAAIADSLGRPDLEAKARKMLGERYASGGDAQAAYREALRVAELERRSGSMRSDSLIDRYATLLTGLTTERDSAVQAGMDRERRIAEALVEVQHNAERWMYIALVTVGLCVLVVIGLLYRAGSTGRKLRASMEALHKELATLRSAGNRRKEVLGKEEAVCSYPGTRPAGVQPPPVDEAMDPVVLAMFRKTAPERLATLRQARERGDLEKALRVVHSLKPQLVSFDEARFAPLCARLTAPGAAASTAQWSADLDALEMGVSELLRAH